MLLRRIWPLPPKMDAAAYSRYRWRLAAILVAWLASLVGVVFFWGQLPLALKVLAVVVATLVTPDIDMIRQVFSSFNRYSEKGLE